MRVVHIRRLVDPASVQPQSTSLLPNQSKSINNLVDSLNSSSTIASMGGGATITRATAKVAGFGTARGGLSGFSASFISSEHSAGNASRLVPMGIVSSHAADAPGALSHRSAAAWDWEVDDWEFAECDSDSPRSSGEPMARVVFGGAPSYEEAEAATAELKDAVEKVYLSSDTSARLGDSVPVNQESILSILPNRGSDTKSYVPIQSAAASPVSEHAIQAFSLLSQNPAAKSIVASIASDPNIWTAVLQNEAFMDYVQSQRTEEVMEGPSNVTSEVSDSEDWKSPKFADSFMSDDSNPSTFPNIEDSLKNMFQNIKLSVTEMVTTVSDYLNNFFNLPGSEKMEENNGLTGSILLDKTLGASFMGLAVLVVMIVLRRRV